MLATVTAADTGYFTTAASYCSCPIFTSAITATTVIASTITTKVVTTTASTIASVTIAAGCITIRECFARTIATITIPAKEWWFLLYLEQPGQLVAS